MKVQINGTVQEVAAEATLASVLAARQADRQGVAVAVDGSVVPRRDWQETPLHDNSAVEVLTAVQGG